MYTSYPTGYPDGCEVDRMLYFTNSALKLICNRNSDGELDLCVSDVDPGNVWRDAAGAWFSSN